MINAKKEILSQLRAERESQKISQAQLADKMGIAEAQLARIDRGEQCSWQSLSKYMNALGLKFSPNIFYWSS